MPKLDSWSIVSSTFGNSYEAPELSRPCVHGLVSEHLDMPYLNGKNVITSPIKTRSSDTDSVTTVSGTTWFLGEPNPEYEKNYPGAKARFFSREK